MNIVLLPGLDGTGALFEDFIAELGGTVSPQVIQYPVDQPLSYTALEAFVSARLPHSKPYVILGESFSGPLAISIASKKPDNLVGLVLCCTFATSPSKLLSWFSWGVGVFPIYYMPTCLDPIGYGLSEFDKLYHARRVMTDLLSNLSRS